MHTSEPRPGEKIKAVRIDEDLVTVDLADGRTVGVPIAWYPRLLHATAEQRNNWRIAGAGLSTVGNGFQSLYRPAIAENASNAPLIQRTTRTMLLGATRGSFRGVNAQEWIGEGEP